MAECSLLGWLTLIVLAATGGVIAWYTIETYRLRKEAQLQTELQNRPFLSLIVTAVTSAPATPDGGSGAVLITNLGKGLARDVAVDAHSGETFELHTKSPITHIAPGVDAMPKWRVLTRAVVQESRTEVPSREAGPMAANLLNNQPFTVVLTYTSIAGQRYRTTLRVENSAVQIRKDERIG